MQIIDIQAIQTITDQAKKASHRKKTAKLLSLCAACTDYVTLNVYDLPEGVKILTEQATEAAASGIPPIASVCVFPSQVETVGLQLGESPIGISAVCGAFPHGQTYIEVKMLECAMALENGADEIEIVANTAAMLAGDIDLACSEITTLAQEIAGEADLKVIIETGSLTDPQLIYKVSRTALCAGADFIKTSTGKHPVSATAAVAVCMAIKGHFEKTGRKAGFIAAGAVESVENALFYAEIVKLVLGEEWLNPDLFRISGYGIFADIIENFKRL